MTDILERAKQTLSKTGAAVDVVKLATSYGIDVYGEEREDDFSGIITYDADKKKFEIVVNSLQHPNRQRFSIAHELAHFERHKDELMAQGALTRDKHDSRTNSQMEEEADDLAGQILLPEEMVADYMAKNGLDKQSDLTEAFVRQMAKDFKVSPVVVSIRLKKLEYENRPYISYSYVA
jgi:Zn-dependent peptidase ImmA (M78 family)